ncbi:hypothetical protein B9Z55_028581 [Caenorhabditis nigoni]|uniref:Uncharacterized protein n=1 Tax=Caenorhabditis nigoni TaxID=1611254 RepID=A0A2G5SB26_9PELO|nr:hypothetical protein B9Z55_028581 [Caenorhabditis nigoni]
MRGKDKLDREESIASLEYPQQTEENVKELVKACPHVSHELFKNVTAPEPITKERLRQQARRPLYFKKIVVDIEPKRPAPVKKSKASKKKPEKLCLQEITMESDICVQQFDSNCKAYDVR